MAKKLSIIICSHNPCELYLQRTLGALQQQTLGKEHWELLLIDNASKEPLAQTWDLSWHPEARHLRENELGLTPARLRGIRESKGYLLVFVDDDNCLNHDYLEQVLRIHEAQPQLGAFGAGRIVGEFGGPVAKEVSAHLPMLALRDERSSVVANSLGLNRSIPYGAGECLLRQVATAYAEAVETDEAGRRALDRKGATLLSCGDVDMALFSCKHGFFTGVFPELVVTHLIPAHRLKPQYIIALAEGHAASHFLLARAWNQKISKQKSGLWAWVSHLGKLVKYQGLDREIYQARRRGENFARTYWVNNGLNRNQIVEKRPPNGACKGAPNF